MTENKLQKQEYIVRDLFLSSFVEYLIRNSYKKPIQDEIQKTLFSNSQKIKDRERGMPLQPSPFNLNIPNKIQQKHIIPNIPLPKKQFNLAPKLEIKSPIPLPQRLPEKSFDLSDQKINLGKINSVLGDPSVFSVESPGPGKNLIINRGGQIMPSSIALTKQEIDLIMNELSDKTRIPLISGGVFRAAFQDVIMTAVVSDYIGTRFLIQKRTPFQKY